MSRYRLVLKTIWQILFFHNSTQNYLSNENMYFFDKTKMTLQHYSTQIHMTKQQRHNRNLTCPRLQEPICMKRVIGNKVFS